MESMLNHRRLKRLLTSQKRTQLNLLHKSNHRKHHDCHWLTGLVKNHCNDRGFLFAQPPPGKPKTAPTPGTIINITVSTTQ